MPHDQPVLPVTAGDGHRFDLIHVPAEAPEQRLLFLPGMGLSARQYIAFGQALASRGIEVFIHEWRGIGSSTLRAARSVDWGYRELLELDLAAALKAVNGSIDQTGKPADQASDGQRIIIGGHSLGSQLACMLAAVSLERPAGLLLVAGGSPYWKTFPGIQRGLLRAGFLALPLIGRLFGHYPGRSLGFAGREARGVMADWAWTGRRGHYALPGLSVDPEARMGELDLEVLALRLAEDWFVPEASLNWLTDKLPRCRISRRVIDDLPEATRADHFGWLRAPQPLAEAVANHFMSASTADTRRA